MRRWWVDSEWDIPENDKSGFWKPLNELYKEYKEYCADNYYVLRRNLELSAMLRSKGLKNTRLGNGVNFYITRKVFDEETN